jgi:hypothetical protein
MEFGAIRRPSLLEGGAASIGSPLVRRSRKALPITHPPSVVQHRSGSACGAFSAGREPRLLRCQPFGTSGLDFVPEQLKPDTRWFLPWRYGRWRGTNARGHGAGLTTLGRT